MDEIGKRLRVTHGTRDDAIRPSNFDPADIQEIDWLDLDPPTLDPRALFGLPPESTAEVIARFAAHKQAWLAKNVRLLGEEYPGHKCDHCGARIRWAVVCKYLPTGENFIVGEICAENRMSLHSRGEWDLKVEKKRAENRKIELATLTAKAKWANEHPTEFAWLDAYADKGWGDFMSDLKGKLNKYGSLSEKQTACITREIKREKSFAEAKAKRAKELETAPIIENGRYGVVGTVKNVKSVENEWGETWKMRVEDSAGNGYWVTAPTAMLDAFLRDDAKPADQDFKGWAVGRVVTLQATWTVSFDDPHFAYGKRPVLRGIEVPA